MSRWIARFGGTVALAGLLLCMAASPAAAVIFNVDHADDICSPNADPCVLSETAEVISGSVLDFGLRTLRIGPNGRIDSGNGSASLRCGELIADAGSTPAIKARGPSGQGGVDGGSFTITVYRGCSNAPSQACLRDSQCGAGTCSVGSGDVTILGEIRAQGQDAGLIDIQAAGSMSVSGLIDASGTTTESDGGSIDLLSIGSDLSISGRLDVSSGGGSGGGSITIDSAADLFISGTVDATGGDFDAGSIDITAEGSLLLDGNLFASSSAGEGWGGEVTILTGADVDLLSAARILANGHTSSDNFGGDGGDITIESLGQVTIGGSVRLEAAGARPDGAGGTVDILADQDLTIDGSIEARARGDEGTSGDIFLDACGIELRNGAEVETAGSEGTTAFLGRGEIAVRSGASVTASLGSSITIDYGDPAFPPVLAGTVFPAALVAFHPFIGDCGICGDGAVNGNGNESCDDGNMANGDGCDEFCQHESCVAATPGYPSVPICDDGLPCTLDRCDADTGSCVNESACSDFIECTIDTCTPQGVCESVPSDSFCDDASVCTGDVCSVADGGCVNEELSGPCDDGLSCTQGDECVAGSCVGTSICQEGFFCSPAGDQCRSIASTTTTTTSTTTTTTTSTTTTTLPTAGVCGDGILDQSEECDQGSAWTVGESCRSNCTRVACGDTDDNGAISAGDALFVLKAAVGLAGCDLCLCDVDASGNNPTAGDSLRALKAAVGLPVTLSCPVCE